MGSRSRRSKESAQRPLIIKVIKMRHFPTNTRTFRDDIEKRCIFSGAGVEACAAVSSPDGAPDLQRALSLLSNSPVGGGGTNTNTNHPPPPPPAELHHHHRRRAAPSSCLAAGSVSVLQEASSPGLWQDGGGSGSGSAALGHHAHARLQTLDAAMATAQELLQLPRPPPSYGGSSSHYDLMR